MDDNFSKLVDIAYKMHISGKLIEAKDVYEKLLAVSPDNLDVLNLYAQLNVSLKNFDIALNIFNQIYTATGLEEIKTNIAKVYIFKNDYQSAVETLNEIHNKNIESLRLLALAYMKLNMYKEAAEVYKSFIDSKGCGGSDLYNLSLCLKYLNNIDDSLKYALFAYRHNNNDLEINLHIASLYEEKSDKENTIKYLINASKFSKNTDILYRIAVLLKQTGKDQEAVSFFNEILQIEPENKKALINVAIIFKNYDKNKTKEILKKLLGLYPNDIIVLFNMYVLYLDMMEYEACCNIAKKLINIEPDNYVYYSLYADALVDTYQYERAAIEYKKGLKLKPDDEMLNIGLALVYSYTNKDKEAAEILKKLPESKTAQRDYTILCLKNKNLEEVRTDFFDWNSTFLTIDQIEKKARRMFYKLNVSERYDVSEELFAYIQNSSSNDTLKNYSQYADKRWKDEEITGKSVLIYSMHGVGDLLMSTRYINQVKEKASKIILQVPSSCTGLFKHNFKDVDVYSEDSVISENSYDFTTPFLCLFYNLNKSLKNIEFSSGYLSVDSDLVNEKSKLDILKTNKTKVGIYWQGNPSILINRSIKLKKFSPLFNLENIQVYSFQISKVDFESDDCKSSYPLIDLAPYIKNYADTAAFLKNIDILITIDTSIAHLAGAMGIKTYLLLPYAAEWRWFHDTETTPWYDSIRIFKQKNVNDWDEVILRVKNELSI